MTYLKVEGNSNLVRDTSTGAILNINKDEISAARKRKLERKQKEQEFDNLKDEVSDIKKMLTQIIEKLDG
jgi:tetrahydromethanopterin S-methyltransferase subunit B